MFENGGEMGMFVTISSYRAKEGEEDAIIALYEDWERTLRSQAQGFLSGELLRVEAQDIPSLQEGIDLVFGWCLIDEPYCAY
jgi:hypothetical protein